MRKRKHYSDSDSEENGKEIQFRINHEYPSNLNVHKFVR